MLGRGVGFAIGLGFSIAAMGTEMRVVRFLTAPSGSPDYCQVYVQWGSQTLFHNTTDVEQIVQFVGVSNGSPRANPKPLGLPPHQTVAIGADSTLDWEPSQFAALWVNHLDVPVGVAVANRVQSFVSQPDRDTPPCSYRTFVYNGLSLPPAIGLARAGVLQTFLGTDVGAERGVGGNVRLNDGRVNLGIYNAGALAATGEVKIYCGRQAADHPIADALAETGQVEVPPNTIVQKTVLASTQAACPLGPADTWYALVTVDQPSFAYAIGLANGTLPTFPGTAALTHSGSAVSTEVAAPDY